MSAAEEVTERGYFGVNDYFTYYPNNILLLAVVVLVRSVPILGKHHVFLLAINALFVLISALMACLTVRNITKSKKLSLVTLAFLTPLLLLSPWIVIPYTDTFATPFPIAIVYLYTIKNKKWWHYLLMGLVASVGFYMKPTTVIVAISIIILEAFRFSSKKNWKNILFRSVKNGSSLLLACLLGISFGLVVSKSAPDIATFSKDQSLKSITMIHYLAMGQNENTLGAWDFDDVSDSILYGDKQDLKKFWNRITSRSLLGHIEFFGKKLAYNYNDGVFTWSMEGTSFYKEYVERSDPLSSLLRDVYYVDGKYYPIYSQFMQVLWILVLELCLVAVLSIKEFNRNKLIIVLALIGLTTFLMIFEPKARYLFCYLPVFITCAMVGLNSLLRSNIHMQRHGKKLESHKK